jgi:hypothetical protein
MLVWSNLWNIWSWPPFRNIHHLITVKTGCSSLGNQTLQFFQNVKFGCQHMAWLLDVSPSLSMPRTLLSFKVLMFSFFLCFVLKLPKLDHPECQTKLSGFSSLAKFGHQHLGRPLLGQNKLSQAWNPNSKFNLEWAHMLVAPDLRSHVLAPHCPGFTRQMLLPAWAHLSVSSLSPSPCRATCLYRARSGVTSQASLLCCRTTAPLPVPHNGVPGHRLYLSLSRLGIKCHRAPQCQILSPRNLPPHRITQPLPPPPKLIVQVQWPESRWPHWISDFHCYPALVHGEGHRRIFHFQIEQHLTNLLSPSCHKGLTLAAATLIVDGMPLCWAVSVAHYRLAT